MIMKGTLAKKFPALSDAEEAEIQAQIAEDPDDWVSTPEELAQSKPFAEVFPDLMESIRRSRGRPPVAHPRKQVSLRLDPAIIDKFKAGGKGWQTRINEALRKAAGL
jgi:uncharacterized protein (DUF4415 family)